MYTPKLFKCISFAAGSSCMNIKKKKYFNGHWKYKTKSKNALIRYNNILEVTKE